MDTSSDVQFLKSERCGSAQDLIDALRPIGGRWDPDPTSWIFRGQGNAGWDLVPKALRPCEPLQFQLNPKTNPKHGPLPSWPEQVDAEYHLLLDFVEAVDLAGCSFPDDSALVRARWKDKIVDLKDKASRDPQACWPPDILLSMLALGQHYGLPTRLLDWTRLPLVAAYFAAHQAISRKEQCPAKTSPTGSEPSELAVWAVHRGWIQRLDGVSGLRVSVVTAPAGTIPNLRAQSGLFTVIQHPLGIQEDPLVPWDRSRPAKRNCLRWTLENALPLRLKEKEGRSNDKDVAGMPGMCCLTLPITEAPKLLRLLAFERVTYAHLFPGYGSVVASLEERRKWDDLPPRMI